MAGGTAGAQALGLAVAPVVTRLYQPEHFAVLAAYSSILGILAGVGSLKYDVAIPLPRSTRAAASLVALSCLAAIVLSGLAALIVIIVRPSAGGSGLFGMGPLIWLVPIGLLGGGVYSSLQYWGVRRGSFSWIARTRVQQSAGQALVQVSLGLTQPSSVGLVLGHLTGQMGGVGYLFRRVWTEDALRFRVVTWNSMVAVAARYRRFSLLASGAGIVNSLGLYIAPLLLLGLYGPEVAGSFALADRMIALPGSLVGGAAAQVYFGEVAKLSKAPQQLEEMMSRRARGLAFLILGPALVLSLSGKVIFAFVFGSDWVTAGVYAQFLAVGMFFSFTVSPVAQNLNVLERQDLSLLWSVSRLALVSAALSLPATVGWSGSAAVGLYSGAMSIAYVALFFVNRHAVRRRFSGADSFNAA